MKKIALFAVLVLFTINICQASNLGLKPKIGNWRTASDDWYTIDKTIHYLWMGSLARDLSDKFGNTYKGVAVAWGIGLGNEIKDALLPWEIVGPIGGDGFSGWDLLANTVSCAVVLIFPNKPGPKPKPLYCARPLGELINQAGVGAAVGVSWIAVCGFYHYAHDGKFFPHGFGKWKSDYSGDKVVHVLANFYTEPLILLPFWANAYLRPYLAEGYRGGIIALAIPAYACLQTVVDDRDVPFIGGRGFDRTRIAIGYVSLTCSIGYELIFFEPNAVCLPYYSYLPHLGLTAEGLSMSGKIHQVAYTVTPQAGDHFTGLRIGLQF